MDAGPGEHFRATLQSSGVGSHPLIDFGSATSHTEADHRPAGRPTVLTVDAIGFLLATNPVVANAAKTITVRPGKDGSLTSVEVKNKSLLAKDFKSGQLPKGATGATGATVPPGSVGPTGPAGARAPQVRVAPSAYADHRPQGQQEPQGATGPADPTVHRPQRPHRHGPRQGRVRLRLVGPVRSITLTDGQVVCWLRR